MKITRHFAVLAAAGFLAVSAGTAHSYAQEKTTSPAAEQPVQSPPLQSQPQLKEDFSDSSLRKFVLINKKLAPHQQEAESQMVQAIQQEGMSTDRFQEILTSQQQRDTSNAGATAAELGKFNSAAKKIMTIQNTIIPRMEQIITGEGMKPEEFQQIVMAYNQSPKVQQRINAIAQEQQPTQP